MEMHKKLAEGHVGGVRGLAPHRPLSSLPQQSQKERVLRPLRPPETRQ